MIVIFENTKFPASRTITEGIIWALTFGVVCGIPMVAAITTALWLFLMFYGLNLAWWGIFFVLLGLGAFSVLGMVIAEIPNAIRQERELKEIRKQLK